MSGTVSLSCPSCGGKLTITDDIDRFACGYCGKEILVNRGGGIVSLKPVVDEIKRVGIGVDKTASELALNRLQKEIESYSKQKEELFENNPQPYLSPLSYGLIVLGVILAFFSISINNQYSTENGQCFIVLSFLMIIGGIAWIFFYNRRRKNWEEEIQNAEKPIDTQISRIQQEIERHKKIVSR